MKFTRIQLVLYKSAISLLHSFFFLFLITIKHFRLYKINKCASLQVLESSLHSITNSRKFRILRLQRYLNELK